MRGHGTRSYKRYHISECLEKVFDLLSYRIELGQYAEYVNQGKILVLHNSALPEVTIPAGETLTGFACTVINKQCEKFTRTELTVQRTSHTDWDIIASEGKIREVFLFQDSLDCTCYINCVFGLPCIHIFALRRILGVRLFDPNDVLPKHH